MQTRQSRTVDPVTVVLVGGGGIVAPDELAGVSEVVRPPHYGAANAVGAALGDISGQSELLSVLDGSHQNNITNATQEAIRRATTAGADPGTVEVVELIEVPVPYADAPTVLIKVRVVGKLLGTHRTSRQTVRNDRTHSRQSALVSNRAE
jgi:hypothetical protein